LENSVTGIKIKNKNKNKKINFIFLKAINIKMRCWCCSICDLLEFLLLTHEPEHIDKINNAGENLGKVGA
tara:strand:+ start:96 stop:305 length:210 start_codon:yes stop_codon:yes gene_type:complete